MKTPKGIIDNKFLVLLPEAQKVKILSNYFLKDSIYFLKKDLSVNERITLFHLQDSVGIFDYDKKTVFQKSRIDNYFPQIPKIKDNYKSTFNNILNRNFEINPTITKSLYIDLKTEFDSFEYLIWLYAKRNFKNSFYIGNSDSLKYRSYSKNVIDSKCYNIELVDKNKNWTLRYQH
jgi:hypothetical protein